MSVDARSGDFEFQLAVALLNSSDGVMAPGKFFTGSSLALN
jgi:hypothetical protein